MSQKLNKILAKIKNEFSKHERYEEMIEDLQNDTIAYWGDAFCDEEFGCNKALAKDVYQYALDSAAEVYELQGIANSLASESYLNDKEWAKRTYEQAIEASESSIDFCDLATSIGDTQHLGDQAWARQLFEKSEQLASDASDYLYLANAVVNKDVLGDSSWARKLYKKSEEAVDGDPDEWVTLGQSVVSESSLGDSDWAHKLFEKAEPLLSDFYSIMNLGEAIVSDLDEKDWARKVYKKAEQAVNDDDDRNTLAEMIENSLRDSEWADSLRCDEDCSSGEGRSTEKYEIYIKSEPAGEYYFGKISAAEDIASLKDAFGDNEKLEALDFWVFSEEQDSLGGAWGVSWVDFIIPEDEDCDLVSYIDKTDGDFNIDNSKNGVYIFCSKPTKLSAQFTLNVSECDFVPSKLEVRYKRIIMPELSDYYGEINISVIIGISYAVFCLKKKMQDSFVDRVYSLQ